MNLRVLKYTFFWSLWKTSRTRVRDIYHTCATSLSHVCEMLRIRTNRLIRSDEKEDSYREKGMFVMTIYSAVMNDCILAIKGIGFFIALDLHYFG
jgi:hypothetical protein